MLLRFLLVLSTGFVIASLTGCPPSDPQPTGTSTTEAAAITETTACTDGEKTCGGTYTGKVAEGNTPPAGANVMVCKDGKWEKDTACDAAANQGCYAMEDPGSEAMMVHCMDATDTMGE